jgi:sugar phosphate isomerase/epimerase
MLSFSTCWNNSRHTEGEAIIDEILDFGIDHIELSHGTTITKLPGFKRAFQDGRFTCVGIHNPFPSPVEVMIDAPDAFEFTSHRPHDRRRALDTALRTLDIAAEFRAHYVVLHMGSVPMNPARWSKKLAAMLKEGRSVIDPAYAELKVAFVKKREKIAPLYYQRAIEALEILADRAKELDLMLAVESRSRFEDVPTEREMLGLLEHFKDHPNVGYWHDIGHVQLKHNLGLLDHGEWLASVAHRLVGGHFHDVVWPDRDHRVPFTGKIEYPPLLRHFHPSMPITWELSPTRKPDEIRDALHVFRHLFPELAAAS